MASYPQVRQGDKGPGGPSQALIVNGPAGPLTLEYAIGNSAPAIWTVPAWSRVCPAFPRAEVAVQARYSSAYRWCGNL